MTKVYGYIRVSTDKQNTENQKFEINKFAIENNLKIDKYIEETISGTKDISVRKIGKLLKLVQPDDIVIATELSRIGRSILQIMSVLHFCLNKNVQVWTIKDNYRLGTDIQSKVLAFAFGLSAEIERNLISQRTKEALARLKSEGRCLGRSFGSKNKSSKYTDMLAQKEVIEDYRRKQKSWQWIANKLNVSTPLLFRAKKELGI